MSQQHIEKFYEIAANDQALLGQLIADTSSPEDFIENAVAAGKERGLDFSSEEASTWIAAQQAAKANGELSDSQLEGVAGGKGNFFNDVFSVMNLPGDGVSYVSKKAASATLGSVDTVASWITSW